MPICTVIEHAAKFVTVIDNKVIGVSRHKDYSLFHFKANDVKALKLPICKFIFVDAKSEIDEVILADQLKDRGINYKTAKRDTADLTDVEIAEVSGAIALVIADTEPGLKATSDAETIPPILAASSDVVTTAIVALGDATSSPGEWPAHADSPQTHESAEVGEDAAAIDTALEVEGTNEDCELGEVASDGDSPADDPLATVKPSRKKRRR